MLRLEKELEDNSAQRIADHALEIKARMEAQLVEWGSMLAGLGLEPPMKRHSPMRRNMAKPRSTLSQSPVRRRPRDIQAKDPDGPFAHEGRLSPIAENKPYPRQTLKCDVFPLLEIDPFTNSIRSHEEILALGAENANLTDSPDLGPPPVSRFVDGDPIKLDSPCRGLDKTEATPKAEETGATSSPERLAPPRLDFPRQPVAEPEKKQPVGSSKPVEPQPAPQPARTGSKRKFGVPDENRIVGGTKSGDENSTDTGEKAVPIRELKNRRSYKELPVGRKEPRERLTGKANPPSERKPLAPKSTNDDVSSPKKMAKTKPPAERTDGKVEELKNGLVRDRRDAKRTAAIPTPDLPRPTIVVPGPEQAAPLVDADLLSPDTPEKGAVRGQTHDTPPPADISSRGETSRGGGRRARSAVSYAEPNLRDKMRRPTKELFDAVSGEGKFVQRGNKTDDKTAGLSETSETPASREVDRTERTGVSSDEAQGKEAAARRIALSPLEQKGSLAVNMLPNTVLTARRKRPSSIGVRENISPAMEPLKSHGQGEAQDVEGDRKRGPDPYEFMTSSPGSSVTGTPEELHEDVAIARGPRMSRRSSGALQSRSFDKPVKPTNQRKRASMVAPKKSSMLHEEGSDMDDEDDSYEPPGQGGKADTDSGGGLATRDRISRRRSMML